jgi:uncharacterized membrane protein
MANETTMESYLTNLRLHLAPLTIADREEIVLEIAAHVRDSAEESGATVEAILNRLGPAEALAAQYRDGLLITKASRSFSPVVLLRATLRVASKGFAGIVVFFLAIFGYAMGGGFVLMALLKPIFPANTGIWLDGDGHFISMGMQFPTPGSGAHVIPGLWYIPVALIAGSLTLLSTTWAIRNFLRLSQRLRAKL